MVYLEKHEIIIILPSSLNDVQRKTFNDKVFLPLIKEIYRNWPSIEIKEIKKEVLK